MHEMYKKLTIIILIVIILALLAFSMIFNPKNDFSESENRFLSTFPRFSQSSLRDGSAFSGLESWARDRIFGRDRFLIAKNATQKFLGQQEINGVFLGEEMLAQAFRVEDNQTAAKNAAAIFAFVERNIGDSPAVLALVPTAQALYPELLPENAPVSSESDFIQNVYSGLPDVVCVDILASLSASKASYIYYRTDHHWTSFGAYLGYVALSPALGIKPLELSAFNVEHASSDFRGTLFSKTLATYISPDVVDIYSLSAGESPVSLTVINKNGENFPRDSLYYREFLTKKDKYATFLGGNEPLLEIESENAGGSLLVFKDSYAHSLIPFLARHYSKISVVDLRYIGGDFRDLVNPADYDQTLFLYSVFTFAEDSSLVKLLYSQ